MKAVKKKSLYESPTQNQNHDINLVVHRLGILAKRQIAMMKRMSPTLQHITSLKERQYQ